MIRAGSGPFQGFLAGSGKQCMQPVVIRDRIEATRDRVNASLNFLSRIDLLYRRIAECIE